METSSSSETLTLPVAIAHPDSITHDVTWRDERITFRPLRADDGHRLARYFASLSPDTRRMFAPHPFTPQQAHSLCGDIDEDTMLRMVAVRPQSAPAAIIAYFVLSFELSDEDRSRYQRYGVDLLAPICRFGPSVSDSFQRQGLGSALFPELLAIARRFGCTCLTLLGGVYVDNEQAIRFYEKAGLRKQGVFTNRNGRQSYDMALWLR
jgi:RimJ/RimL family protein N-acetyltransferase